MSSGTVQICIRNKLLPKPLWAAFDTDEQARAYAQQLEGAACPGNRAGDTVGTNDAVAGDLDRGALRGRVPTS